MRWLVVLAVLTLAVLMAAFAGIELEGDRFRAPINRWLSAQLGREARIDGQLRLRLGIRPGLLVRQLHVAQPAAFGSGDLIEVGELRFELDLIPLLRGQWRAKQLSASAVRLDLRQTAAGATNWRIHPAPPEIPAPADASANSPDTGATDAVQLAAHLDIRELQITGLQIRFQDEGAKPVELTLDSFHARLPTDAGVIATAQGHVQQKLAYQLRISGGSLRELALGDGPWPLNMQLQFAGSTLTLNGYLGGAKSQLRFGLGTTDLAQFGQLLGIGFPDAGVAGVSGRLTLRPGSVQLDDLSAQLGRSSLRGSLMVDLRRPRPRLEGELDIAQLDLQPFLGQEKDEDPPADLAALVRSLSRARLDLSVLHQADAKLHLSVGQWISLPGDLQAASLTLHLAEGRLQLPMRARLEGVPIRAVFSADAHASSLSAEMNTEKSPVGGLAHLLTGLPGIEGKLGKLRLSLSARGKDGASLMRSLSAHLALEESQLSYGNIAQGKPVDLQVSQLAIDMEAGKPLQGTFRGALLGKPLEARLSGADGRLSPTGSGSRFTLIAQSRGVAAQLQGSVDAVHGAGSLSFSLGAERAGDVAAWLGLRNEANLPLALAGRIAGTAVDWRLTDLVLQAGRTSAWLNVERQQPQGRAYYRANLEVSGADLAELDSLLPPSRPNRHRNAQQSVTLNIPILPRSLTLDDADVRVRVHGIERAPVAVGEIGADVVLREGVMQSSPFFAELAGQRFEGALMMDTRSSEPHAQLWVSAPQVNAGQLARELKLAQGLDLSVGSVSLYLDSRAARLSDFIAQANIVGEVSSGQLIWRDPGGKPAARLRLDKGSVSAAPGEPVTLALLGDVDGLPIRLSLRSATAKALLDPARRVPFDLSLAAADSQLSLSGTLDRTLGARDIELQMKASGERLNTLDRLARIALPPWGPWSLNSRLRVSSRGYALQNMLLTLGSSTLQGEGTLDTSASVPTLDMHLKSPQIQLDDFALAGWSATETPTPASTERASDTESLRQRATQASDRVQGLLSRETLRRHRATLSVEVDRVLSGPDILGGGQLQASMGEGRARLAPLSVQMPGGSASLSLLYEPGERDVLADLKIKADRFDYGVLGRRLKPGSDLAGRFSLNVDVRSRAPKLSEVISHGSGTLDFALWPQDLKAGVFDLWAVNLFLALLPTIDPKDESRVNCAVGRFIVHDGQLTQKQLVIDTTRMRVTGTTAIDLAKQRLHLRLQPQAKTAQFLSLATPVEVKGSLSDYAIGPTAGDVLETVVRLATSVVWVPIKRWFSSKLPEDGSDVCVFD